MLIPFTLACLPKPAVAAASAAEEGDRVQHTTATDILFNCRSKEASPSSSSSSVNWEKERETTTTNKNESECASAGARVSCIYRI